MTSVVMSNVVGGFVADIYVSEKLNRQLVNVSSDLSKRCVYLLAEKFNFNAEEAIHMLGLENINVVRKSASKGKKVKAPKIEVVKAAFPMPFNGEFNDSFCYALRQNNGLYTQCTGARRGEGQFCKGCAGQMAKSGAEIPEYGTIQQRMAVGIFEYVDPKGRKPVAYTKVMKKYKLTQEMVLEEAGKLNLNINPEHFVAPEESVKRGRPASKEEKEAKSKGVKGRPKKSKKVIEIDGDEEDLFASLVKTANMEDSEVTVETLPKEEAPAKKKKAGKSEEEKEAERLAKEAEKKAKEDQRLKEKAEKEAKLAAEKAEKEAKKEAERLAKEAKKKAEEEEKAAKKAAAEKAKEEAKKAKEAKKPAKAAKKAVVEEDDEEPDVVKKIEFEGKKYLKSKKTGIVYDYDEYTKNGEQVVVGKWNETSNKIDFESAEVEEEEYDE